MNALPWGTYRALAEKLSEYLPIILYASDGVEASKKAQRRIRLARGASSNLDELLNVGGG